MDFAVGFVKLFHGGNFVGPPLRYENYQLEVKHVDSNFEDIFQIRDYVTVDLGYSEVSVRNIYYKGLFDDMEDLKPLDDQSSFEEICEFVMLDAGVELYVDHAVAFAEVMLLLEEAAENIDVNGANSVPLEDQGDVGGFDDLGTQGMDDMGGVTQEEVNEQNLEEFLAISSAEEDNGGPQTNVNGGPQININGGPPTLPTTTDERSSPRVSGKTPSARERYKETIRRYKQMDFADEDVGELNDPPTGRGQPSNIDEVVSDGETEDEGVSDGDSEADEADYDSDSPNVIRPLDDEDGYDGAPKLLDVWYNPDTPVPIFKCGMKFKNHKECREAARRYGVVTRTDIRILYNDKRRQKFFCYKCPWMMMASRDKKRQCFRIRKLCDYHRCQKTVKGRILSARELAVHMKKKIVDNPFYKVRQIQEDAWKELKYKLKWDKCLRAKKFVLRELEGNFQEEYGLVESYAKYLNSINPGNNVKVVTGRDTARGPLMFRKMYFCLGVIKEGWKKGCRPILGVDGCFLKSISGGVLLTAIGRDGNGGFYPVAWAVVASETLESWQWFFQLLQGDLELGDGENFTVISDQAQAIISAIKNVIPQAEHRLCVRHVYCNVAKRHGLHDDDLRMRFWNAAKATYKKHWEKEMVELYGVSPGAYNEMMQFEKETWCKAFFACHSKCASPDNNITESFNAWIPFARGKAIISMNETIMNKLLVWFRDHKRMVSTWDSDISPKARAKVNANLELRTKCHVIDAGEGVFKVFDYHHKTVHRVRWSPGTCTCRRWQLTGIPCEHVLATIADTEVEAEALVHDYYKKEKWLLAYGKNIEITRGPEMWNDWEGERPEPPISQRKPGRPRVNRMKPKCGEVKRVKSRGVVTLELKDERVVRCSICGVIGHNKRTCPQRPRNDVEVNGSAAGSFQAPPPQPTQTVAAPASAPRSSKQADQASSSKRVVDNVATKRKAAAQPQNTIKKPRSGKGKGKVVDP